ncbi:Uncharacterised protein [Pseudomonas aeruginosa]|nr:Uncharacterised protein [Pseudomonas aeruginosa]
MQTMKPRSTTQPGEWIATLTLTGLTLVVLVIAGYYTRPCWPPSPLTHTPSAQRLATNQGEAPCKALTITQAMREEVADRLTLQAVAQHGPRHCGGPPGAQ